MTPKITEHPAETMRRDAATAHFSDLETGMCNMLVPPSVHAALTGVQWAKQTRDGAITLTYTDGTQERRNCRLDMCRDFSGIVGVIDYVQEGR